MKEKILTLFLILFESIFSQSPNITSQNACLGNDHSGPSGGDCTGRWEKRFVPKHTPCAPSSAWKLVFQDEFDGPTLDTSVWYMGIDRGVKEWCKDKDTVYNIDGGHNALIRPDNFLFDNGILKLTFDKLPSHVPKDCNGDGLSYNYYYSLGAFGSWLNYRHGFFEIRCKVPSACEFNPSFWLFKANGNYSQEVDVFELLQGKYKRDKDGNIQYDKHGNPIIKGCAKHTEDISQHVHRYLGRSNRCSVEPKCKTFTSHSDDYHTYGVLWDEYKTIWFIDGKVGHILPVAAKNKILGNYTGHINSCGDWDKKKNKEEYWVDNVFPSQPMDIRVTFSPSELLNLTRPDYFPHYFNIDYIRVWQRVDCNVDISLCSFNQFLETPPVLDGYYPYDPIIARTVKVAEDSSCNYVLQEDGRGFFAIQSVDLFPGFDSNNKYFEAGIRPCPPGKTDYEPLDDSLEIAIQNYMNAIQSEEETLQNEEYEQTELKYEDIEDISFTAQPNPFYNEIKLTFSLPKENKVHVRLSNILGETIEEYQAIYPRGVSEIVINTTKYPAGLYLLYFQTEAYSNVQKFVKYE